MRAQSTESVVAVLKAVAHPLRLGILAALCEREEHVTGLADRLRVSRSAVSGSLAPLRMLHLVEVSRRDGHATYRVQDDGLRALVSWARAQSRSSAAAERHIPGIRGTSRRFDALK